MPATNVDLLTDELARLAAYLDDVRQLTGISEVYLVDVGSGRMDYLRLRQLQANCDNSAFKTKIKLCVSWCPSVGLDKRLTTGEDCEDAFVNEITHDMKHGMPGSDGILPITIYCEKVTVNRVKPIVTYLNV